MKEKIRLIKELREKTNISYMHCKEALQNTSWDVEKAIIHLRGKGQLDASKRHDKCTNQGIVASYIHNGSQVGALIELNCETDFVARSDEFKNLAHRLAMHVVAVDPTWINEEDIPEEVIVQEKDIYKTQSGEGNYRPEIIEKQITGRMKKFVNQRCMMKQTDLLEIGTTIEDLLKQKMAILGENIKIKRFSRFRIGEEG